MQYRLGLDAHRPVLRARGGLFSARAPPLARLERVAAPAPVRFVTFAPGDATGAVQGALDAGPGIVVLHAAHEPWVVGPLFVRGDDVTLVLLPGAELRAKLGAYESRFDSMIEARGTRGTSIVGYGATLRMLNGDDPDYADGEWRAAISLEGADDVRIAGLTITRAGGDGVFVGGNWQADEAHRPSKRVVIEDCAFIDNRRQGVSVISVDGLMIRRCAFRDTGLTSGTDPMAGIDFEPDHPWHRLAACVVEDSVFINNRGSLYSSGIHAYLGNLDATSAPVDISVRRCTITSTATDGTALVIDGPGDTGPEMNFLIEDVLIERVRGIGMLINSSAASGKVTIRNTTLRETHTDAAAWGGVPIYLEGQRPDIDAYGGIVFDGLVIEDGEPRPFLRAFENRDHIGMAPTRCGGLSGTVTIIAPAPGGEVYDLHLDNGDEVDLSVIVVPEE
ncbi:MAG: right-handed parallel beta-helix repeat-containing protein [Planctomycetota bacterium]